MLLVSHEPYKNCFAFLFKIYVKQSQIWDTLPTSKMKLFVTIGLCKIIFCRLMILYTQYCPMSVLICVSLLLVSLRSEWFHLQTSEMVLFVKNNYCQCWILLVMVLQPQFLPTNFLFFVLVRCWIQLVPGVSSSFQVIPAWSSFFLVLGCTQYISVEFRDRIIFRS